MDSIKGVGAADYAMIAPQNNQVQGGYDDYSTMPIVYEPEAKPKKGGVGLGTLALTGLACAAIGGFATKKFFAGKELEKFKLAAAEATKNYEAMKVEKEAAEKAKEAADAALVEYRGGGVRAWWKRAGRLFIPSACYSKEEKAARKAFQEAEKKAAKEAKEAKKAAKEVDKTAADKAKTENTDKTE